MTDRKSAAEEGVEAFGKIRLDLGDALVAPAFQAEAVDHVGNGAGSGMAVMFLCTGVCGFAMSILSLRNKKIQELNDC